MQLLKKAEATWNDTGIDLSDLLNRVEYDRELLRDMLDIFVLEFPAAFTLLADAVAQKDARQMQTAAHTLKGMLASLSFVKAAAVARRIEHRAREGSFDGLSSELGSLELETAVATASLEKVCRGQAA